MNREELIRMAREAGWEYATDDSGFEPLWRFAALVAAAERERIGDQCAEQIKATIEDEREACAKVCEGYEWVSGQSLPSNVEMAAAIRARGQA